MIDLLDYLPLLVGLFNLFLYNTGKDLGGFQADGRVYGIVFTNIGIGALHAVFPWRPVIQKYYDEKGSLTIEKFDRSRLETTYEKSYPASKPGFDIYVDQKELQ
jgi:hypothetical protein